ncbi:sensor histidine kinase [Glaciecola sp. 1036]|uniref:sensor histidine kinase n=1 Tax=Alteromonadaceae TaxID=72275 RepID=UPI003CFFB9B4
MLDVDMSQNAKSEEKVEFSSVMAVAIHDMKNSLSLLMQSIEQLADHLPSESNYARERLNSVHYEANRMNTTLVQVLSLYRASIDALPINVDEVYVSDLIEEVVDSNAVYIKDRAITVESEVDEDLSWFFDRDLIYLLIYDVLINAIRYGGTAVQIKAWVEDEQLQFQVSDNGPGYPSSMLEISESELSQHSISEGRTGLGLFFARLIAQTHKNKGKQGKILLSNGANGGSNFKLVLP